MKQMFAITMAQLCMAAALLIFGSSAAYADTKNGLCLTEPEFTNVRAMGETDQQRLEAIKDWLDSLPGFFKGRDPDGSNWTFTDVDGNPTDPAQEISDAAGLNKISPRVLLTTLRKEQPTVFRLNVRPSENILRKLAGCGTSSTARQQIQCMGQKLKEWFYDQLSQCKATPGGWNVDLAKQTGDKPGEEKDAAGNACSVEPESKAVTALYQYTPWIGDRYGCGRSPDPLYQDGVGGNGLFCAFWGQHGWQAPPGPLAISQQNPALACDANQSRCVSLNASGGTPPYTWSVSNPNAVIQLSGVNNQNIRLKPPPNPGGGVGGIAYAQGGMDRFCGNTPNLCKDGGPTQGCAASAHARLFGCQDQDLGPAAMSWACGNFWSMHATFQTCFDPSQFSHTRRDTCSMHIGNCNGKTYSQKCEGTGILLFTDIVDRRSQSMINAGCKPCNLELKDGATVTVTDAAGNEVETTLTVQ